MLKRIDTFMTYISILRRLLVIQITILFGAACSSGSSKILIAHEGVFAVKGTLYRLLPSCSSENFLIALRSSSSSSISLKFSAIREGVTDLGMTEWPPTWLQARMTWAGVAPFFSAIALTSGRVMRSGMLKKLLPNAE